MCSRRSLLIVLVLLVAFSAPFARAAQDVAANQSPPTASEQRSPMRVVVDGSKNPELIPDRVALGMFFSAIAIPANADKKTVASMNAKLTQIRLSGADMAVLRQELAGLDGRLTTQREAITEAYEEARRVKTPEAKARVTLAVEGRDTLASESYERLLQTLSPAGAKQLVAQLANVKTQIKSVTAAGR